jgi:hypothetical protein
MIQWRAWISPAWIKKQIGQRAGAWSTPRGCSGSTRSTPSAAQDRDPPVLRRLCHLGPPAVASGPSTLPQAMARIGQGVATRGVGGLRVAGRGLPSATVGAHPHEEVVPLIVRVPSGSRVERQLRTSPPPAGKRIVLDVAAADSSGQPPSAGTVVLALPSPEGLLRERDALRRTIAQAGQVDEPLIVLLEAASELREDELRAALEAADRTERAVMLVVLRDG